jgi:hypothetical protein
VLETFITCLMMACETHERAMIESMVKAIVNEYSPQLAPTAPAPVPVPEAPRLGLIRKFVPFRI